MEQLVVFAGQFSSHHFRPVFSQVNHRRFFSSPPPLHRFIFTSPSHTTKKTERIRTFHTDANYLVMSLCKRINHNQSLKIKSKLINLQNVCFTSITFLPCLGRNCLVAEIRKLPISVVIGSILFLDDSFPCMMIVNYANIHHYLSMSSIVSISTSFKGICSLCLF